MKTLVINTGSSSIKYQLFRMPEGVVMCSGLVEQIGEDNSKITHKIFVDGESKIFTEDAPILNHQAGMTKLAALLTDSETGVLASTGEIDLVGHRVVHGGEQFAKTSFLTNEVIKTVDELSDLAPLHNPPNLVGIRMAKKVFKNAKQIGVFDTAFHQSIPEYAYRYALPNKLYEEFGVRVYGFHGTSHRYISKQTAEVLNQPLDKTNLISIHLGNGASIAAIQNGQSIDTSLGLTPLPGLVMGTRSGDIDPAIIFYLNEQLGMPLKEIKNILYKESGMKGLTSHNDLRKITEDAEGGDKRAELALAIYAYRIKKYIGSYLAIIGNVDAIVFTAGVGENSPVIRALSVEGLENFGIILDPKANNSRGKATISATNSRIKILVIPTNEELEIAHQSYQLAID